jgi:hypothetical protein
MSSHDTYLSCTRSQEKRPGLIAYQKRRFQAELTPMAAASMAPLGASAMSAERC